MEPPPRPARTGDYGVPPPVPGRPASSQLPPLPVLPGVGRPQSIRIAGNHTAPPVTTALVYDDGTEMLYDDGEYEDAEYEDCDPDGPVTQMSGQFAQANFSGPADDLYGGDVYGDPMSGGPVMGREAGYGIVPEWQGMADRDAGYGIASPPQDQLYGADVYDAAQNQNPVTPEMARTREEEFYGLGPEMVAATASQLNKNSRDLRHKTYGEIVFGDLSRDKSVQMINHSVARTRQAGKGDGNGTFLFRASSSVISGVVISVFFNGAIQHFPFKKPSGSKSYVSSTGKPLGEGIIGLVGYFMRRKDGLPCLLNKQILPAKRR